MVGLLLEEFLVQRLRAGGFLAKGYEGRQHVVAQLEEAGLGVVPRVNHQDLRSLPWQQLLVSHHGLNIRQAFVKALSTSSHTKPTVNPTNEELAVPLSKMAR